MSNKLLELQLRCSLAQRCIPDAEYRTRLTLLHDEMLELIEDHLREATKMVPPPECKTEAEKTAFAFGWFKALESVREKNTKGGA